jgi:pectinesterase
MLATRASALAYARQLVLAVCALVSIAASAAPPDAIVSADGTGKYKTIREAVEAAPQITRDTGKRWTILVKPGIYRELVYVQREKRFISLVGEDTQKTIVTFDLFASLTGPDDKSIGTFRTPTLTIDADDFTVENLTVENSAGPRGQALALRVDGDRVVFRRCRFLGWQDTILCNRGRHYFEDCHIEGAVDFIFGGGTAFFERCRIRCMGPGYITAASTPDVQPFGFVFSHCTITSANPDVKTFLGRPWRDYAKTVFLDTEMSDVVRPTGWDNWKKPAAEKTTFYAEFASKGLGASTTERAPWSKQLSATEAANYSRENVLAGADNWDPMRPMPPVQEPKKRGRKAAQ